MATHKRGTTTAKTTAKKGAPRKGPRATPAKATRPTTTAQYLAALPPERRVVVEKLKDLLDAKLPKGFEGTMGYGMLAWVVPHSLFPDGYHCDPSLPLPFINVASQKQYVSLYHMGLYDTPLLAWLKQQWPKHTSERLDVGKCCLRFKKLDKIPWALIGELATKMTPAQWIDIYRANLRGR